MIRSLPGVFAALLALTFIVAACASESGTAWTFAPVTASSDAPGSDAEGESATQELSGEADPAEAAEAEGAASGDQDPSQPVAASGEPRVIELNAEAALAFTDPDGQKVTDIPVTPGETIVFQVDNTAGFEHNFYIGTDEQLSVAGATTDTGIANWTSGVQELTWVVPDDITGLKFGCTVAGHYALMNGTFSLADAPATSTEATEPAESPGATEPAAPAESAAAESAAAESAAPHASAHASAESTEPAESAAATESVAPAESAAPAASAAASGGEGRVIDLNAEASLQFTDTNGQKVTDIPVTPGETVLLRIDNTGDLEHNFYIGEDSQLSAPDATTDTGIPTWASGVQELEWVVPDDITGLKFGCTVPGHYSLMQGTFSVSA